ncbi:MAG: hypothetical protein Q4F13_01290 [Pseudomonadota bacterium]|nr:hypothetical protein [Pseudomonadota bacterium]
MSSLFTAPPAAQPRHWLARAVLCAASAAAPPALSQPATATVLIQPDELMPPRMVLCERELGGRGEDRAAYQRLLNTCLSRRFEGERMVERQCKRQTAGVDGQAARHAAQRDCERQALAVSYKNLPRRPPPPPPPPRPMPLPINPTVTPSVTIIMPAAGDM